MKIAEKTWFSFWDRHFHYDSKQKLASWCTTQDITIKSHLYVSLSSDRQIKNIQFTVGIVDAAQCCLLFTCPTFFHDENKIVTRHFDALTCVKFFFIFLFFYCFQSAKSASLQSKLNNAFTSHFLFHLHFCLSTWLQQLTFVFRCLCSVMSTAVGVDNHCTSNANKHKCSCPHFTVDV